MPLPTGAKDNCFRVRVTACVSGLRGILSTGNAQVAITKERGGSMRLRGAAAKWSRRSLFIRLALSVLRPQHLCMCVCVCSHRSSPCRERERENESNPGGTLLPKEKNKQPSKGESNVAARSAENQRKINTRRGRRLKGRAEGDSIPQTWQRRLGPHVPSIIDRFTRCCLLKGEGGRPSRAGAVYCAD